MKYQKELSKEKIKKRLLVSWVIVALFSAILAASLTYICMTTRQHEEVRIEAGAGKGF